jgi:hypothetical protein
LWVVMYNFQLEKAYDKVMMEQLTNRKKGVAYGAFKVLLIILSLFYLKFLEFERKKGGGLKIHDSCVDYELTSKILCKLQNLQFV